MDTHQGDGLRNIGSRNADLAILVIIHIPHLGIARSVRRDYDKLVRQSAGRREGMASPEQRRNASHI